MSLALGLGIVTSLVIWVGAELILGIFGTEYAEQGSWTLRIMALGIFPLIIKDHFVAICRITGQIPRTAMIGLVGSGLELGAAALGAWLGGLNGLAMGFVLALTLEAAYMGRPVFQLIFPKPPSIEPQASEIARG